MVLPLSRLRALGVLAGTTLAACGSGGTGGDRVLFSEDFEGANPRMVERSAGNTPQWTVDDPSLYGTPGLPRAAAQGSRCAGTVFSDVYGNDAEDLLSTPELDLSGATRVTLTFQAAYDFEELNGDSRDGVRLLASPDRGQTWSLLAPSGGYPAGAVAAFANTPAGPSAGWGGQSIGWQSYSVDLSPLVNVGTKWLIAWEFASDSSVGYAGFFLDDVKVTSH